jgi:hypothetical protein
MGKKSRKWRYVHRMKVEFNGPRKPEDPDVDRTALSTIGDLFLSWERVPKDRSQETLGWTLLFRFKDDVMAEQCFQRCLELFDLDAKTSLMYLNDASRFGSSSSRTLGKRAELLFREKRFVECIRDVDVVLASSSPNENTVSLVALKAEALLNLNCPKMSLSFLKIAEECFQNIDLSNGKYLRF